MDPQNGKKFIIIADDNALIAKVLFNKLSAAGYEVQVTADGEETLQAVAVRKPDLLLLDLIMPVKDGFTTLKELRANPATKDLKIVITSDLQQEEDMQKVQELGVLGIFDKVNLQGIVDQTPRFLAP
jgi:CheY-like chemotaxis protein